jgi:hypothetical protein
MIAIFLGLLCSTVVFGAVFDAPVHADPEPAPTDRPCTRNMECPDTQYCVKLAAGLRCARPCNPKRPSCKKDQRCVKDGPTYVCRSLE